MKSGHGLALAAAALALSCDRAAVNPDGSIGSAISTSVVISQVYGGGGNTGATYKNDFIELFNKGDVPVDVGTWSVQYSSATGTGWSTNLTALSGTIPAGGYFLVGLDSSGMIGLLLPAPDVTDFGTNMSATSGKVALVSNTTALVGICPTGAGIVDFIGYGTTANCAEGVRTGNLSATAAAIRKGAGCRDTDQNSLDFSIATPTPRNSASPAGTCAPTGVGAGDPNPVGQGGTTLLTVTVSPGTVPPSTGLAVVADLSGILGSAGQMFFDDGSNGDAFSSDNVFSFRTTVSDTVTAGAKALPFTVSDAEARVDTSGSFVLDVVANAAPDAVADSFGVLVDTARNLDVLANDTDADSDTFRVTAITVQGARGTAAIVGTGASIVYTPNPGEVGGDAFAYRITDSKGESDDASVALAIQAVLAEDDDYAATEDVLLTVPAPGVLGNDSAAGGASMTAAIVNTAGNGVVTLAADGSFTYAPGSDFFGVDSFTYTASTTTATSFAATVTLTVANAQDAPVAVADTYDVTEDVTLNVAAAAGVLANDVDPDPDTLTAILVTTAGNGTVTLNADGSFGYTPNANYNAGDSFTYEVNDGTVNSGTVSVTLTFTAVNDAPVAAADAYPVDEDTPIAIVAPGLVGNDSDVEGSALAAVVVDPPDNGTFTNMAGGAFLYEPDLDFNGVDTMTYVANDGAASSASPATVTFTIAAINDAPTAVADVLATDEDLPLVLAAAAGLLVNDGDVDGDAILPIVDAQPSNGTLALSTDGALTYTPAADFNGTDSFTYHVTDGAESSTIAAVMITVDPLNDAPTVPAPVSPGAGESISAGDLVFTWAASTDVDGDPVDYRVHVFRDGNLYAQAQSSGTTATIPGELPKGDFTWRVQADDGVDDSGFSAEVPFTIKGSGGGGGGGGLFGCSTTGAAGPSSSTMGALLAAFGICLARRRAR